MWECIYAGVENELVVDRVKDKPVLDLPAESSSRHLVLEDAPAPDVLFLMYGWAYAVHSCGTPGLV